MYIYVFLMMIDASASPIATGHDTILVMCMMKHPIRHVNLTSQ